MRDRLPLRPSRGGGHFLCLGQEKLRLQGPSLQRPLLSTPQASGPKTSSQPGTEPVTPLRALSPISLLIGCCHLSVAIVLSPFSSSTDSTLIQGRDGSWADPGWAGLGSGLRAHRKARPHLTFKGERTVGGAQLRGWHRVQETLPVSGAQSLLRTSLKTNHRPRLRKASPLLSAPGPCSYGSPGIWTRPCQLQHSPTQ